MRRSRHTGSSEAEVNMTPMLDIVFILLIFFIVTATFIREVGIDMTPPPPSNNENQDKVPVILIRVDENSFIRINNGRRIDVETVRGVIERLRQEDPRRGVIVQAHPKAKSGYVIRIIDQAKLANAPVSLVSDQI